ncbi:MAG TPA: LLM class flavin-dependent oxidoreductase [Pseudonocardiaceae bacterium]|jgi:alkanesulfonate monooxygenase SsuD/methylene tetrahydromethanopterin reductase-like flavin-dependent oxidoreductase (luciferase family)|nr:LLM class flavin-dependent oxidoreductase [Pseudonocardiaceae bacterium]
MTGLSFGLGLAAAPRPGYDPVADGRRAEELGFDFLSISDHPADTDGSYEAWTVLSWIAASTSRIQLATRVLGVPYRPPALVAKMAETFDRLSGGRLILGLGGGYSDGEFRAFGLPVPTAREKVDGLADAIRIARGLWSEPGFSYAGRVHHVDNADVAPRPEHRIPIWLGTFGDRALAVTGQLADGWIPSLGSAPVETVTGLRDKIRAAAEAAGRDPGEITCGYHFQVDPSQVDPSATAPDEPWVVSGPVDKIAETLAGFAGLGFSALSIVPGGPDRTETVERLAAEIIPAVRELV